MRSFLIRFVSFVLLLLVLASLLDWLISYRYRQRTDLIAGEFVVWNDIYAGNIQTDYVIYGSSRAWVQFNPAQFIDSLGQTAYNLGVDGQNFQMQHLRHLELLRHNAAPKNIILSLDLFSLEKNIYLYNETQYLPYQLFNTNFLKYRSQYVNHKPALHFIPLLRYAGRKQVIGEAFEKVVIDKNQIRIKGYMGQEREWTAEADTVLAQLQPFAIPIDDGMKLLFENFLQEMKRKQVNVVLVNPPEYVGGQGHITNRNEILAYYAAQAKRFGFPFLDYSGLPLCLEKTNFYNSSHLNARGATLFTAIFLQELKKEKAIHAAKHPSP